jgi:hypothetical protein
MAESAAKSKQKKGTGLRKMRRTLRLILFSGRRRRRAAGAALWLLRQILDAEKDDARRSSDLLGRLDSDPRGVSWREHGAAEEACASCECAVELLESAIEEIECAY